MKSLPWWKELDRPSRILILTAACIASVLIIGTLVALGRPGGLARGGARNTPTGAMEATGAEDPAPGSAIVELGRIRATSGGKESADIIISLSFPYDEGDLPWSEELQANKHRFRESVSAYFAGLEVRDLKKIDDEQIRQELMKRFNESVILGRINQLWIHEYMIVE